MIYGETHKQKQEKRKDTVFIWWPTSLEDGRTAWLETVRIETYDSCEGVCARYYAI